MGLIGEDETESVNHNIELVVKDAIVKDAIVKDAVDQMSDSDFPPEMLKNIEHNLISKADRTFLWASLIIEHLRERVAKGASRHELYVILKSMTVDSIYVVLLKSNANHLKARKMLNIILTAVEPLTVEALSIAPAAKPDHQTIQKSSQNPEA